MKCGHQGRRKGAGLMTATMGGMEGGGEARREEKEAEMKAAMPKDSAEDAMQCDCCIGNATNHECNSSNIATAAPATSPHRSKCCMANAIVKQ